MHHRLSGVPYISSSTCALVLPSPHLNNLTPRSCPVGWYHQFGLSRHRHHVRPAAIQSHPRRPGMGNSKRRQDKRKQAAYATSNKALPMHMHACRTTTDTISRAPCAVFPTSCLLTAAPRRASHTQARPCLLTGSPVRTVSKVATPQKQSWNRTPAKGHGFQPTKALNHTAVAASGVPYRPHTAAAVVP